MLRIFAVCSLYEVFDASNKMLARQGLTSGFLSKLLAQHWLQSAKVIINLFLGSKISGNRAIKSNLLMAFVTRLLQFS